MSEGTRYFEVGEPLCLYTLFPVRDCDHCRSTSAQPVTAIHCTKVDPATGTITFTALEPAK